MVKKEAYVSGYCKDCGCKVVISPVPKYYYRDLCYCSNKECINHNQGALVSYCEIPKWVTINPNKALPLEVEKQFKTEEKMDATDRKLAVDIAANRIVENVLDENPVKQDGNPVKQRELQVNSALSDLTREIESVTDSVSKLCLKLQTVSSSGPDTKVQDILANESKSCPLAAHLSELTNKLYYVRQMVVHQIDALEID